MYWASIESSRSAATRNRRELPPKGPASPRLGGRHTFRVRAGKSSGRARSKRCSLAHRAPECSRCCCAACLRSRATGTDYKRLAAPWHGRTSRSLSRNLRASIPFHSPPHRFHVFPILWILLAQPPSIGGAGHHDIEPQGGTIRIRTRIQHVVIDLQLIQENVPIPRFLQSEFVQGAKKLIDDPFLHEFLERG